MLNLRNAACIVSAGLAVLSSGLVFGQDYPSKPIRIVTTPVGAGPDFIARLIAQELATKVGWQVIVDNRPGGVIQGQIVAQALPDGYTLIVAANPLWLLPLMQKVPYDAVRDFSPVTLAAISPNTLLVHTSVPAKSVKELIALAKVRPGELNCATGASGGANHLAAELFKAMAGVNIVRVAYKGAGPALNALIGGEVQLMFASAASGMAHVKAGRLKALAVTSAEPSALVPGLPTVAASGVPGYESVAQYGLLAPAKTPAAIVRRLNQEIVRVFNQPDVKQKLFDTGTESVGSSPEQFATAIKSASVKWSKVIKDAGITAD